MEQAQAIPQYECPHCGALTASNIALHGEDIRCLQCGENYTATPERCVGMILLMPSMGGGAS